MNIKLEIDDKKWGPETKSDFRKAVKMMAKELADSINRHPKKYSAEK